MLLGVDVMDATHATVVVRDRSQVDPRVIAQAQLDDGQLGGVAVGGGGGGGGGGWSSPLSSSGGGEASAAASSDMMRARRQAEEGPCLLVHVRVWTGCGGQPGCLSGMHNNQAAWVSVPTTSSSSAIAIRWPLEFVACLFVVHQST